MMMHGLGMSFGMSLWMLLWATVGIALLAALGVALLRMTRGRAGGLGHDSAEAELRRRYAAGEIGDEEFAERSAVLRHDGGWGAEPA